MTTLNLDYLKTEDSNLYAIASKASGQTTGQVELSMEQIKVAAVQLKIAEAEPQISMAELDNEFKRELQTKANEQAARNRLNEWAIAGLQDTQNNADLISAWLRQNQKFSAAGVDEAIASLGPRLTWKLKTAAPKAPQLTATGEVLGVLPNGEKQLPLEVSNYDLKKASVAQAKDYLKRVDQQSRDVGRFSSKFI